MRSRYMKLLTKELEKAFRKVGSQEDVADPVVVAKFFNPTGGQTWLAMEYNPERKVFFGYVSLFNDHCNELGDFSLEELESVRMPPFGLGIERDMHFTPAPLSEVKARERIV